MTIAEQFAAYIIAEMDLSNKRYAVMRELLSEKEIEIEGGTHWMEPIIYSEEK